MSLLEDIVAYLTSKQLIAGDGIDTFRDFLPESPDNVVSLHEYAGDPLSPYTDVAHRSVQIVVRNNSSKTAKATADTLLAALRPTADNGRVDFTPTRWGQVHIRQCPIKIKQDENDRTSYGFNLGITTTTD